MLPWNFVYQNNTSIPSSCGPSFQIPLQHCAETDQVNYLPQIPLFDNPPGTQCHPKQKVVSLFNSFSNHPSTLCFCSMTMSMSLPLLSRGNLVLYRIEDSCFLTYFTAAVNTFTAVYLSHTFRTTFFFHISRALYSSRPLLLQTTSRGRHRPSTATSRVSRQISNRAWLWHSFREAGCSAQAVCLDFSGPAYRIHKTLRLALSLN